MNGHNHPLEDETVSDIEADEDQDTRINENDNVDNKEFFYDPPKKPLGWLSHSSAPGKDMTSVRGLYIDAHPVRLADISLFDEETDKNDLTIATAVATVLWNWHPNALRALLDCDRFYTVAWARHVPCVGLRPMVIVERNDHALTVSTSASSTCFP